MLDAIAVFTAFLLGLWVIGGLIWLARLMWFVGEWIWRIFFSKNPWGRN